MAVTGRRHEAHAWPSAGELLGGSVLFAASVTPSLYPRAPVVQGVLSGLALVFGVAVVRLSRALTPKGARWRASVVMRRRAAVLAGAVACAVVVAALALHLRWQVEVRRLMGIEGDLAAEMATVLAVAVVIAALLMVVGRALAVAARAYLRQARRVVRWRWLRVLTHAVVAAAMVGFLADVLLAGYAVRRINERLAAAAARFDPDVEQPTSPHLSGSPTSLVEWSSLGRPGRAFVAAAPSVEELAAFDGSPATPPIRVYVGVRSAASVRERAALAVQELERTGAFDRAVLAVVTPTGTGSVNRWAVAPLEYLHGGDTAAVAVQYSYLPSWVVMGGNQDRAAITARAVFTAIQRRLDDRPPQRRPRVLLYGESLGSFGSEQVFADLEDVRRRVDGVLWVGPPRANRLWRELTSGRDRGSPVWRPVVDGGRAVRFGADGADLQRPGGMWEAPRIVYLQHGTDPVTWWSPDLLLRRPEWLGDQRPPDISRHMPYLPIVTFVQTTIDTVLGGGAPMHFGHIYGTEQAEAWALIAPPSGWTTADTQRLVSTLDAGPDGA